MKNIIPTFYTSRLILRQVTENDFISYEKNFVDYNVIRFLTAAVPWPYPQDGVKEYLRTQILPNLGKDKWHWVITLKENPEEVIGVIDLYRKANPANRGFWLGHKYWGNGYMTEAVEPVMDYAFEELGFEKLTFANAVENTRSGRIKEKTGARLIKKEPAKFVDPAFTEHYIYELSKNDWVEFKNRKK